MTNRTLILVFSLIFWSQMIAQPAQFYFGDLGKDQIAQMIPSTDGNFLATGSKMIDSQQQIWLLKVNKDGVVLWEKTFLPSDPDISGFGHSLTVLTNGQIIISAEERTKESFSAGLGIVIKTDANGDEIWTKTYSDIEAVFDAIPFGDSLLLVGWRDQTGASNIGFVMMVNEDGTQQWLKDVIISSKNKVRRIFPTDDGNFILLGRANVIGAGFAGIYLQKIDSNGTLIWQKTLDTGWREPNMYGDINYYNQPLGAVQMPDGTFWIVNPLTSLSDVLLLHFSEEGELLSQKKYGDPSLVEEPYGLTALPDGGWLITGESYNNSSKDDQVKGFAMQVDSNGLDLWRQYYGEGVVMNRLFSGVALDDGQLLMGGASTSTTGNGDSDGWLLRTDADGNALPWTITGQIIIDENNNCLADPGEQVAKGWFIEVTDTATQYVITDDQGQFQIRTGDGTMTLKAIKPQPSDIWQFCSDSQTMTSNSNNPVGQLTFLAQAIDGGCAHLEVGITQPDLMRCETSTFIVTVQNRGSGVSEENLLELVSDPEFTILSASEPYFQNGNIIEFDIDPMDSFQQKSIAIKVQLSCDVQVGATHEMVARILPGKCTPLWDGPRFTVQGFCGGDEVVFFLNNDGGGGSLAQSRYRVISDYLLHTDWTEVVLPEGGLPLSLSFPADGRSWRVELEQAPNFPTDSHPAAAIEGCGTGNNGLHAIAFRNAWRFDDGMPEVSAVLAPNTTGVPNRIAEACPGMSEHNFISNADWLEFTARVQNPFPTTVGSAIFRFSFSTNLDLSTFQVVASNGPVDMKMENQKFITTRMNGLQIEPGGMFMVRFRIRPIEGTLPDMWQDSYFSVNGDAYVDNHGPFPLIQGFNRYSVEIPSPEDIDNTYPPEILLYGGRDSEFGVNMTLAKDGNVFLIGDSQSYSDNSNTDGFIIKADTKGRAYWLKAIDLGDQGSNSFKGIVPSSDGGCMVSGNHRPPNNLDYSLSSYSPYIARLDILGEMVWNKKFRPAGQAYGAWTSGLLPTSGDASILYGYTLTKGGGTDQFYIKINHSGDTIWQQYGELIGSAFKPLTGIQTADGGFVFVGTNKSTLIDYDVFLEKIDANGQILWSQGYNSQYDAFIVGLSITPDGGYMVCGESQWQQNPFEIVRTPTFIRFNSDGEFLWEKSPVVGPAKQAGARDIIPAPGGGYFTTGEINMDTIGYQSDLLLLKIDENAEPLWWRNFGTTNIEWATDLLMSSPDQLLLWGNNQVRPAAYNLQAVLVPTDMNGNIVVGLEQIPQIPLSDVTVFPNPANHGIHIDISNYPEYKSVSWLLSDLTGRQVHQGISPGRAFDINLEKLSNGMYVLSFPQQGLPAKRIVLLRQ